METEGRNTDRAGNGGASNVVPFPRDWIGPPEDLVPLGGPELEGDEELGSALGADAFWGERSASLHEPIEAPAPPAPIARIRTITVDAPGRGQESSKAVRPHARLGGDADAPGSPRRPRSHARLGVGAVAMTLASALAVGIGLSSRSLSSTSAGRVGNHPSVKAGPVSRPDQLSREMLARVMADTRRKPSSTHRTARPRVRTRRTSSGSSTAAKGTYTGAAQTGASTAAGTGRTSSYTTSSLVGTTSSSSTSTAGGSSDASGPVGPGAPFGPGQMGG